MKRVLIFFLDVYYKQNKFYLAVQQKQSFM